MADVGYVPGPLTAVVGESCLALVETAPDSPAGAWIWQQVGLGASAQRLLAGLLGASFEGVGGFTLLDLPADGPIRLFCRGAVGASVVSETAVGGIVVGAAVVDGTVVDGTTAGGDGSPVAASTRIDGIGMMTWREHVVAVHAERVCLGPLPDDGTLWLPAATGVVLAGCLIADLDKPAPAAEARPGSGAGAAIEASADASAVVAPAAPKAAESTGAPKAAESAGVPESAGAPETPGVAQAAEPAQVSEVAQVAKAAEAPGAADPADPIAPADPADPTARRADRVAGVPAPPAADGWFQPASSNGRRSAAAPDGEPDPEAATSEPDGADSADGLTDGGPWGAGPGAPDAPLPQRKPTLVVAPPPAPTAAPTAEKNGRTVKQADPVPVPASEPPSERIVPDVPALVCPAGHINAPSEQACRQCGEKLPSAPVMVPRPVLGVLRLSTGDVLALDRDMVLGRNPTADAGGPNGVDRPDVIRLPSTDGELSRAHVRITLSGWHVLVTDLNSTNGTRVTMPGREPEQLPAGVPVPIRPGTVIALAEGVDFRFEGPE